MCTYVFPELHTRIWMRSNACCLDPTHFAKPHRNRFWSLEPFSRGVRNKSPENEKLWIENSWVVLKFFIAKLKMQNVLFLCKMVTAWLTFAVKVYDQTRKANGIPETLFNVRFYFKSKKALFPRFPFFLLLFLFFSLLVRLLLLFHFFSLLVRLLQGCIPAEVLAKPASSKMTSSS